MSKHSVELLAPARNADIGITAINCGADAVYIGAPQFSARAAAGNSIQDIERLATYAHKFNSRVLVALNTLLRDNELPQATQIAWDVYNAGADALIIQDFGLLQSDLPPIRLHASTQCNNTSVEQIQRLEQIGFSRAVLARELSLDEIRSIRQATSIELEAFIHGALCVSYSGQCYMSEMLRGRSANRGECAQMCRLPYDLLDAEGNEIIHQKHLLSLRDMNRSAHLLELADAGITTFKIEGRLKDEDYVKNIVTYYRQLLDCLNLGYQQSYNIESTTDFIPDPEKTFHRSETDYFLQQRTRPMANFDTPKSTGEEIGKVIQTSKDNIRISTDKPINIGDGICIASEGFQVSKISRINNVTTLYWDTYHAEINTGNIQSGMPVFRNADISFLDKLKRYNPIRKRPVAIAISETGDGFCLSMQTTDGITATHSFKYPKETANNPDKAQQNIKTQLSKLGDTIFTLQSFENRLPIPYFIPISVLNNWRRLLTGQLEQACLDNYQRPQQQPISQTRVFADQHYDQYSNIANKEACAFYIRRGAELDAKAITAKPAILMRCRYCLKHELGWCHKNQIQPATKPPEPYYLRHHNFLFKLSFDCKNCQMRIERN